jgi:hypothetical protein
VKFVEGVEILMGKGASRSIRGSEERIVRRDDLDIF